jgi:vancomycin aglycone glucosyltransferase
MRVLLTTYGSREDVEPLVGLAVRLRALGAKVCGCVRRRTRSSRSC